MTTRKSHRGYLRLFSIIVILLGFGLRVYRLGFQELRGDETFGYFFSLPTFSQIIQRTFELQEPHPVASYFVQSVWLDWAGHSEYALRFPSAWFSLLAVALLLRLAWSIGFPTAAIGVSGLLLAANPYAIWHSQDARMYSMSLAMTIASSWFFVLLLASYRRAVNQQAVAGSISSNFKKDEAAARASGTSSSRYSGMPTNYLWLILGYLLVTLLALHTHYFSTFVVIGQNLFVLLLFVLGQTGREANINGSVSADVAPRDSGLHQDTDPRSIQGGGLAGVAWPGLFQWLGLQLALSLAYLPWLIPAQTILSDYGGNGDSPSMVGMLGRALRTFAFGETIGGHWVWPVVAVSALIFAFVLKRHAAAHNGSAKFTHSTHGAPQLNQSPKDQPPKDQPQPQMEHLRLYLLLYMLVPLFVTWFSALRRPIFDERYLIAAAPPFLLLISYGLTTGISSIDNSHLLTQASRWLLSAVSIIIAALVCTGSVLSLSNHYANSAYSKTIGWRQLAHTMEQLSAGYGVDSARLIQNYPDPTLWYYYRGDVAHIVLPPRPLDAAGSIQEVEQLLNAVPEPVEHVVMALQPADNWDNSGIAQQALATEYTLIGEMSAASWPIQIYARPPKTLDTLGGGAFINGLQLSQASVAPMKAQPGGILSIHLGWTFSQPPGVTLGGAEKLFLHLVGTDGGLLAQRDVPLNDAIATVAYTPAVVTSYGILIPTDAPAGEYHLFAGLYDPAQTGAPRILTTEGVDAVPIAQIIIEP